MNNVNYNFLLQIFFSPFFPFDSLFVSICPPLHIIGDLALIYYYYQLFLHIRFFFFFFFF